jgi:hypothetical protein
MWARFPVVVAAVTTLLGSGPILAQAEGRHPRLRFPAIEMRFMVDRAIDGAKQRLADPDCQQVFADFQDVSGNSLLANLSATGQSPAEYLDGIWFIDASTALPCQKGGLLVAYTSPGHRVVYVCGSRFVHPIFRLDQRLAELLIIHELLHSLGLGENPPTSSQITKQVAKRCNR